ncbi:MAG: 3-deoxy-D-manno-octulosonic acid transferase [Planctomycetes bacterium]|nr:3-deoxy-D-manno-octulosonic acid transferase [Planctomycetota bacterium]
MPFFGWMLNAVYCLLLLAVAPVLLYRRLRHGKYRGGWREKLTGQVARRHPDRQCIWFHAVSVGEVLQLKKVLDETAARFPEAELFVTTTTDTGYGVACEKYPQHTVAYFPLDFTWAVARALTSIRPDLVVLVELELWPNFIFECRRQRIPLALINGRIGEKSFRGYSRLKPVIRRVLNSLDVLAVQNDAYRDRLLALGAPAGRVVATGNIKFDRVEADRSNSATRELRQSFGIEPHQPVFIAGSTQSPEELYALDAWRELLPEFPNLRLILVPRHKERFDEVADLVQQKGIPLLRRSELKSGHASPDSVANGASVPVLLLDTLGELAACWGLADIAFVGGSLTNRGGQNMLEPAGYGAAVLFGPNTWNFKDITQALLSRDAARVVSGPAELKQSLRELLQQPMLAHRLGTTARTFVAEQQGATARTVDQISALLVHERPQSRAA